VSATNADTATSQDRSVRSRRIQSIGSGIRNCVECAAKSGSTLAANDKAAMTREVLAKQIVEMGQTGERDQSAPGE
jgi:hypothetical protein